MNKKVFKIKKYFSLVAILLLMVIFGCESNDNPVNYKSQNLKASNKVLVELFTNTSCVNCPQPGGYLDLVDSLKGVTINDTNVVIIRVHTDLYPNDPFFNFNSVDNLVRENYYSAGLYNPIGFMNGANLLAYNFNSWTDSLNLALSKPGTFAIVDTNVYDTTSRNGTLNLTLGQLTGATVGDLKMHVMITEGHMYYIAPNGERWFENTLRKIVTPSDGIAISLSSGQSISLIQNYTLPQGINAKYSQIIVFLQSTSTAKVYAVDEKSLVN